MKIVMGEPPETKASELVPGDACAVTVTDSSGNYETAFCIVLDGGDEAVNVMEIDSGKDFYIEPGDIVEKLPDAIFCPYGPE